MFTTLVTKTAIQSIAMIRMMMPPHYSVTQHANIGCYRRLSVIIMLPLRKWRYITISENIGGITLYGDNINGDYLSSVLAITYHAVIIPLRQYDAIQAHCIPHDEYNMFALPYACHGVHWRVAIIPRVFVVSIGEEDDSHIIWLHVWSIPLLVMASWVGEWPRYERDISLHSANTLV